MDERNEYLIYVSEVLGARSILRPKSESQSDVALSDLARTSTGHWPSKGGFDLIVLHRGAESFFKGESLELWSKMRSAMKISHKSILELETDEEDIDGVLLEILERYPSAITLLLIDAPRTMQNPRALGVSKIIESFSPTRLLQTPELKKQAWSDLQLVMTSL